MDRPLPTAPGVPEHRTAAARPAPDPREPPACAVCATRLTFAEKSAQSPAGSSDLLCVSHECRMVMARGETMPPRQFQHYLQSRRREIQARNASRAAEATGQRERVLRRARQRQQVRQRVLAREQGVDGDDLHVLDIPSGPSALAPLPAERRADYRAHLLAIIEEAMTPAIVSEDAVAQALSLQLQDSAKLFRQQPDLQLISDRLCALCAGGCCTGGRDSAYLSSNTVLRLLTGHPELSGDDILQLYLGHLAEETVADSCINHTASGCSLPRALRSTICNGFYCAPLTDFHREREGEAEAGTVVAIQRSLSYWQSIRRKAFEPEEELLRVVIVDRDSEKDSGIPAEDFTDSADPAG